MTPPDPATSPDSLHAHLATTRAIVRSGPWAANGPLPSNRTPNGPFEAPVEARATPQTAPARFGRLNGPPLTAIRH
jgi:hypothetical protein